MRVRACLVLLGLLVGVPGCTDDSGRPGATDDSGRPGATSTSGPALPDGWRWESYHDVEVGVPGDWEYAGYGMWTAWCADGVSKTPGIARPSAVVAILCRDPKKVELDPGSLVANTGSFAAFVPAGNEDLEEEGDRRIVHLGETDVVIQASAGLRDQIAATAHRTTGEDHNGCPLTHALSRDPSYRPAAWDPASVGGTTSVNVCRYELASSAVALHPATLLSSLRLTGAAARDAVAAILAAPVGGGPNRTDPKKCDLTRGYGFEGYLLRIARDGQDPAEIVVHYSGCTHNGFDDGRAVRTLTAEGLAHLVAQPNRPSGFIGDRGMLGLMARAQKLAGGA